MTLNNIIRSKAKLKSPKVSNFGGMGIGKTFFEPQQKLEGNRKSRRMQAKKNRKK